MTETASPLDRFDAMTLLKRRIQIGAHLHDSREDLMKALKKADGTPHYRDAQAAVAAVDVALIQLQGRVEDQ